jgi:hypothetical protein
VERKDDVRASTLDPDDIVDRISKYVDPLIQFFRTADATAIARFRNRGSSLQSVDQNCLQMMAIIQGVAPDFDPVEVRAYIESHAPPPCSMVGRLYLFGDVERDLYRTSRLKSGPPL